MATDRGQETSASTAASSPRSQRPRYSFVEIKEAQRVCSDTMMAAALEEVRGSASAAQQQIFRAHVNDLCATVFAAALRKYNPEHREEMAPVDAQLVATLEELKAKVKAKEAAVKKLQEQVPMMAAASARRELANARKRCANVLVTQEESTASADVELTQEQTKTLETVYAKAASSIAVTSAKLSQTTSQTTETIDIVEQAMKRPKTQVDLAMENSPIKPKVLLTQQGKNKVQNPCSLRTRLTLQLSASGNV
ncbi:unnamed protein product [Hyaloperonospora brassicae]|uniref:Uncharacterized protein n=1 Tax=Hyaloperonospora brassicae TaxID=162125 RepID=A0AAV0UA52_HYABA|nr:unnamed protein product [Hyaloperonospora brassicae]